MACSLSRLKEVERGTLAQELADTKSQLAASEAKSGLSSALSASSSLLGAANILSAYSDLSKMMTQAQAEIDDCTLDAQVRTAEKRLKLRKLLRE